MSRMEAIEYSQESAYFVQTIQSSVPSCNEPERSQSLRPEFARHSFHDESETQEVMRVKAH